ncbi:unnamed protein product [Prorocentrum cordatum]|uniref:Uncharacterized protein n=1 Tax=Prorocentrum cordatum TaxID=2364126 RepID=A0ABN9XTG2_9DINO|nr:unnamed protein product [Polarella glacialis]
MAFAYVGSAQVQPAAIEALDSDLDWVLPLGDDYAMAHLMQRSSASLPPWAVERLGDVIDARGDKLRWLPRSYRERLLDVLLRLRQPIILQCIWLRLRSRLRQPLVAEWRRRFGGGADRARDRAGRAHNFLAAFCTQHADQGAAAVAAAVDLSKYYEHVSHVILLREARVTKFPPPLPKEPRTSEVEGRGLEKHPREQQTELQSGDRGPVASGSCLPRPPQQQPAPQRLQSRPSAPVLRPMAQSTPAPALGGPAGVATGPGGPTPAAQVAPAEPPADTPAAAPEPVAAAAAPRAAPGRREADISQLLPVPEFETRLKKLESSLRREKPRGSPGITPLGQCRATPAADRAAGARGGRRAAGGGDPGPRGQA